jgi:glucose-6-phosphate 1-epimerase
MTDPGVLKQLQDRYEIPGGLRFEAGPKGLIRAVVATPQAGAQVYLHGAHVTHYQPRGERPVLFMSAHSWFEPGKPIRGGVPIVFPWFGPRASDPSAPAHGFARLAEWHMESATQAADGSVTLVLGLDAAKATNPAWPHAYELRYRVGVGGTLGLFLEVRNTSDGAITFEEALHTYLAVSDVRRVSIAGLAGADYLDKTDGMRRKTQGPDPIRITGETDRVYLNTQTTCVVDDPAGGRRLVVNKQGSDVTVVWDPWVAKAQAMPDFGDDEWPQMLCIETCNAADHAVTLPPGHRHEMRATIRSEPRYGGDPRCRAHVS